LERDDRPTPIASGPAPSTHLPMRIFTIGHSNLTVIDFVARLQRYQIEVLVDVRSAPFSHYCPQFNRPALRAALQEAGIYYTYAGSSLGGKPAEPELCRADGGPDYDKMAAAPLYRQGLQRLLALGRERRVAVMCAEGEPERCHRHKLIARSLFGQGVEVCHVLAGGALRAPEQPWVLGGEGESP
jgi:uncharacterized protein (DUF488 family)